MHSELAFNEMKPEIEEMTKDLKENLRLCAGVKLLDHQVETIAYELSKKYQPRLSEDRVVLTREEYQEDFSSQFNVEEIETIIKSNLAEGSFASVFAKKVAAQIVEHYQSKVSEDGMMLLPKEEYEKLQTDMRRLAYQNCNLTIENKNLKEDLDIEVLKSKEIAKKIKDFILFLKLSEEADSLTRLILREIYWQVDGFIKNNLELE